MSTSTTDLNAAVKARAEQIVAGGEDVRARLAAVVTQNAGPAQQSGEGLVALARSVIDGAREGLARSVPEDRSDVLRQVVDALGDGFSQAALAVRLAVEEAAGASRQYAGEDLARFRDDLTAVRELFVETVEKGLKAGRAFTAAEASAAVAHAERVAEHIRPALAQALDAIREHPAAFAREGVRAGMSAGRCAAGELFEALGDLLRRAGGQMRREGEPGK